MVGSRPVGCPRPARVRQNPTAPQQAYAPDMPADPTMRRISSAFPALCAASPALPSAIGWATGGPRGALPALPRLVSVSCCGASPLRSAQAPPALAIACRLARRPPPSAAGSLPRFRERAAGLLAERGWKISAATAASSLALWLVLLASVRRVLLFRAVTYLAPIPVGALAASRGGTRPRSGAEIPFRDDSPQTGEVYGLHPAPARCQAAAARPCSP